MKVGDLVRISPRRSEIDWTGLIVDIRKHPDFSVIVQYFVLVDGVKHTFLSHHLEVISGCG